MKQRLVKFAQRIIGYKKVGGLHFVRVGRLGFSFFIAGGKKPQKKAVKLVDRQLEITYN
jgi:hypothetical protein